MEKKLLAKYDNIYYFIYVIIVDNIAVIWYNIIVYDQILFKTKERKMARNNTFHFCLSFYVVCNLIFMLNSCGLIANSIRDSHIKSLNYPLPLIDKDNAEIIDLTLLKGHAEDYIKIHSYVKHSFTVLIWVHDIKTDKWLEYGVGVLKGFGDTDTVDSIARIKLDTIKYIAIQFTDGEKYNFNAYKNSSDVHINIRE